MFPLQNVKSSGGIITETSTLISTFPNDMESVRFLFHVRRTGRTLINTFGDPILLLRGCPTFLLACLRANIFLEKDQDDPISEAFCLVNFVISLAFCAFNQTFSP